MVYLPFCFLNALYMMRFKARTKATGIAPKRYEGKGAVFKIGNRKCIATITKVDKNELFGEKVLYLFTNTSYLRNQ